MSASVNTLFKNQHRPVDYIVKKEIHRHPLVNKTMFKKRVNLNRGTYDTLYWLIVQAREQRDSLKFTLSNSYIKETLRCGYRTVSTYYNNLEKMGYIIRSPVTNSNGKVCRTTNYFEICWLTLYKDFGEDLFTDFMENMVTFIKGRIAEVKAFFKSLCLPIQQTDKLISSNEDIYNNNIYGNLLKFGAIFMEQEVLLKGEYDKNPLEELLEENEAENRSYFNRDIRICPDKWREVALKVGIAPEYIDDEFIDFRDYWLSQGKIKHAKKANWTRTWQNRIRDVIHNYKTSYKSLAKQTQQEQWKKKLQDNCKDLSLIYNHGISTPHITFQTQDRMPWNKELASESFWKIPGNPDISQFTAFYTSLEKGGNIVDTKSGWLQRGIKWHERNRIEKSPSVRAYGEAKSLEVKIPEEMKEIHMCLANQLEEHNYIAWVQSPKIIIQEHASPCDRYLYSARYTDSFMKKTVLERYRDDFEKLKIEII